jgi:hypothetical protein
MAKFAITDSQTGKRVIVSGDAAPTESDVEQIFQDAGLRGQQLLPDKPQETSQALGYMQGVGKFMSNAGSPAVWAGEKLGIPMEWAKEGFDELSHPERRHFKDAKPGGVGRFVADVISTLPTMLAGPLPGGALAGYQLREDDTLEGAATGAALGGIGGKLGDKLVKGISSVVSPTVSKYARALLGENVRLTPGQMLGGTAQRIEDKISSIPVLGDVVANARIRGLEDFNRAAVNRSLTPIGAKLPDDVAGRDAVQYASDALSNNYNNLLKGATFKPDQTYGQRLGSLLGMSRNIPEYGAKPLRDFIATNIRPRMGAGGSLSGEQFKEIDSLLGQEMKDYLGSQSPNDRKLGRAFQQLQAELKNSLGRSNPTIRSALDNTDEGFANLVRVQNASSRGSGAKGVDPGVFSPSQLSAAVRATDQSVRKNRVAKGTALLQDLSDAGTAVLPQQVPDSGTAGRMAAMLLAGGTASNVISPAAVAPIALAAGAYTKPGIKAMEYAIARRPQNAKAIADFLRKNSKTVALPSAVAMSQLMSSE